MRWTLVRNCIFTASVLVLPGCLLVNAALTGLGFLGGGLEYAGTVYSVAEYTYEYAVNDKTPDEVIEDKMAWLITPGEKASMVMTAEAESTEPSMADRPNLHLLAATTAAPAPIIPPKSTAATPHKAASRPTETASVAIPAARKTKAAKPKARRQTPSPVKATMKQAAQHRKPHSYIERDTDPVLVRLNRLELAFRQAEHLANRTVEHGIKISVQPEEPGINGAWSIRHPLMQHGPGVS